MDAEPQQARLLQVGQADASPLLLLPGALTAAQGLLPVARVLEQRYRVGVLDVSVPIGGGECFSLQQAVTLAANAVRHLVGDGEKLLVLGESAGGLIGLEVARTHPALLAGLVLADPPLAPAKLWPVRSAMQQAIGSAAVAERSPAQRFFADYARELFGYAFASSETASEPPYFDILHQCPVPVLILTGDEPLYPIRQSARVPCLLEAEDLDRLRALEMPGLSLEQITGADHIQLRRDPRAVLALIERWLGQGDDRSPLAPLTQPPSSPEAQSVLALTKASIQPTPQPEQLMHLYADSISQITLSNNNLRIQLVQNGADNTTVDVGTLILPITQVGAIVNGLNQTLQQLDEQMKAQQSAKAS